MNDRVSLRVDLTSLMVQPGPTRNDTEEGIRSGSGRIDGRKEKRRGSLLGSEKP